MMKFFKQKNKGHQILSLSKGFTLVETLVAISIFTTSILGLMAVLSSGISSTNYAKKKMTATYLAQEGIEYARNLRDTAVLYDSTSAQNGWDTFIGNPLDLSSLPSSDSNFPRTISMARLSRTTDEVQITSTVTWTQGSGTYSISFSENLFNWIE